MIRWQATPYTYLFLASAVACWVLAGLAWRRRDEPGGTELAALMVAVSVGTTVDGFYVADDGPGIPEGEREAVFDSGYTTATDGTGLGLDIVSTFAEAHGWTVELTESEAAGTRIAFRGVERPDS